LPAACFLQLYSQLCVALQSWLERWKKMPASRQRQSFEALLVAVKRGAWHGLSKRLVSLLPPQEGANLI
jgi:hypothetical protein